MLYICIGLCNIISCLFSLDTNFNYDTDTDTCYRSSFLANFNIIFTVSF